MTDVQHHPESEVMLTGLTGGNLLAYLAALGTFRVLSLVLPSRQIRMGWRLEGGAWRPVIHAKNALSNSDVAESIMRYITPFRTDPASHPIFLWENWLLDYTDNSGDRQRLFMQYRQGGIAERQIADWLTGIGTEINLAKNEEADSALRAPRADYFGGNLKNIITKAEGRHIEEALFRAWTYSDPMDNLSLKFDPSEDRRHAFQWAKPSGDPERKNRGNVLGANRLALEAIPLFPTAVDGPRLTTPGFTGKKNSLRQFTWGVWGVPVSLETARSLITLAGLVPDTPVTADLKKIGLPAVYRCRRETVGKTRIFTPAFSL